MERAGRAPELAASHSQQGPAQPRTGRRGRAVAASATAAGRGRGRGGGGSGRGAGRGRKRAREPDPPPAPLESDSDASRGHGDHSDEGHSEDASRDEADEEEEAADAQPAPAPPQLTIRQQAVALLVGTGVLADRAELALAETAGEQEPTNAADWAEDAQMWLACQMEFEVERDELAAAMDVSLREAEQRKKERKPLTELTPQEVQQEFSGSELLGCLLQRCSLESLLEAPLRDPLLGYLQLEKRCKQWYSISCHYFQAAAAEVAAHLDGDDESCGAYGGGAAAAAEEAAADGQPPPSKRRRVVCEAAGGEQAGSSSDVPAVDEEQAAVLAVGLELRRELLQEAAYAMPAGDGPYVPALFAAAVPPGAEDECVVVDSDSEAPDRQQQQPPPQQEQQSEPGGGHRQQQQQQ